MRVTCDFHIHTQPHLPADQIVRPEKPLPQIFREAEASGITEYGIADHIHGPQNLPAIEAIRRQFDEVGLAPHRHFSAEVSCVRQWDLDQYAEHGGDFYKLGGPEDGELVLPIDEETIERFGMSYVLGAPHRVLGVPYPFLDESAVIRNYHRQNMFLASHPLVDVVVHPWWWYRSELPTTDPRHSIYAWTRDFTVIPNSMHDEFAAAAIEHNTAIEINSSLFTSTRYSDGWHEQYLDYLLYLRERGVTFAMGSDNHCWEQPNIGYRGQIHEIEDDLDAFDFKPGELWRPSRPPQPSEL